MEKSEAVQKQQWVVNFLKQESRVNEDIENIYLRHAEDVLEFLKDM